MSQNIPDESQTPTEQPTGAALIGKMTEAIGALNEAQEHLVDVAKDVAKHTTDPNAHGAATLANIAKALPTPVLEDGMFTFKDAAGKPLMEPVNIKGDPGEQGEKGDMPDHRWSGTSLQLQNPDGSWGEEQDLQGPKGTDGAPGLAPEHEWDGTSLKFKNPDGTWGEEQDLQGPQGAPGDTAIATAENPGLMQPDGVTTQVDEDGVLSALGGNLLLNSDAWITESGTWTAPEDGWYELAIINGGNGARGTTIGQNVSLRAGASGLCLRRLMWLSAGQEVPVTIGAGGIGAALEGGYPPYAQIAGGVTSFNGESPESGDPTAFRVIGGMQVSPSTPGIVPAAPGGGYSSTNEDTGGFDGIGYGAGGSVSAISSEHHVGNGKQGAVRARWHDPAKAGGPAPEPALFAARRMAPALLRSPWSSTSTTRRPGRAPSGARRMRKRSSPRG